MASLKKKQRSPFWYIKYRDTSGKIIEESTNLRHDLAGQTRKAKILKAERTQEELQRFNNKPACGQWSNWVPDFLQVRYENQVETFTSYQTRWNNFQIFLEIKDIPRVQLLKREHADQYMNWRKTGCKEKHVRRGHHNTALAELKLMTMLLDEAVQREYILRNPFYKLGIRKVPAKEKPEMTDEEIELCRILLKDKPDWMTIAFEIALFTGCRLAETNVILSDVVLGPKPTVTFRNPKGGRGGNKDYTVPLHAELVGLFEELKCTRTLPDQRAYDPLPPEGASEWWTPSRAFHRMFKGHPKLKHLTFHCLRVTFITRGAREHVDITIMMKLVNHATEAIHRIYQRLGVADMSEDLKKISLPKRSVTVDMTVLNNTAGTINQ